MTPRHVQNAVVLTLLAGIFALGFECNARLHRETVKSRLRVIPAYVVDVPAAVVTEPSEAPATFDTPFMTPQEVEGVWECRVQNVVDPKAVDRWATLTKQPDGTYMLKVGCGAGFDCRVYGHTEVDEKGEWHVGYCAYGYRHDLRALRRVSFHRVRDEPGALDIVVGDTAAFVRRTEK